MEKWPAERLTNKRSGKRAMKKVGILTFHDSDNFGSVLQAFATCQMLHSAGFQSEIIDLRKPEVKRLYRILPFSTRPSDLMAAGYNLPHYRKLKRRKIRYEQFRKEQMKLSPVEFSSGEEMEAAELDYNAYIVGSDQVWNVDIADFDRAYFLPYAKNAKRIAYAASFGPLMKEKTVLSAAAEDLRRFDLITVRERIAADMVEAISLPRPQIVPDPVFFLSREEWTALASPTVREKPFMLCYFPGVVTKEFDEYTRELAEERGLERVFLMPHWRNLFRKVEKCYDAGPREFLALMRDAEMVCTNSFHAAAFSIIFNKELIVGTHTYHSDARMNTLLSETGLQDCEFVGEGYVYAPQDMEKAAQIIREASDRSKRLLLDTLEH